MEKDLGSDMFHITFCLLLGEEGYTVAQSGNSILKIEYARQSAKVISSKLTSRVRNWVSGIICTPGKLKE